MNRRWTTRRVAVTAALAGASVLGAGLLHHARNVEPEDVEVVSLPLVLPRLDGPFDGYRIALIGDFHADAWMTSGRVLQLVDLVNAQKPDVVMVTGDFATHSLLRGTLSHHVPKLAASLKRLHAPDGVFAVLGNHDNTPGESVPRRALASVRLSGRRTGPSTAETVRRTLAASNIVELRNAVHTLRRGDAFLHLCGVDSAYWDQDDLASVLDQLPAEGAAILLVHEPDFADTSAATGRFDLQLSGHSHGGQVRVSMLGEKYPIALPPLGHKYPAGLYTLNDMLLYTNRGLGSHPRLRLNCRPEITIIDL